MKTNFLKLLILLIAFSAVITGVNAYPHSASLLVFPLVGTSVQGGMSDTQISVTNIGSENVIIRYTFFFYNSCQEYNADEKLTPKETFSFNASKAIVSSRPAFLIVAPIYENGTLRDYDYLIGQATLLGGAYNGMYNSWGFEKIKANETLDENGIIIFGENYVSAPKVLVEDNILSQQYTQKLAIIPSENILGEGYPSNNIFSFVNGNIKTRLLNYIWNDLEQYKSNSAEYTCGFYGELPTLVYSDLLQWATSGQTNSGAGWLEILKDPNTVDSITAGPNIGGLKIVIDNNNGHYSVSNMHPFGTEKTKLQISSDPPAENANVPGGN